MARNIDLPQTKGVFELRGIVTGMQRNNAYKTITTKKKKDMRILTFGVNTAPESATYVNLQGTEKDEVYFLKRSEKKGEKPETIKVKWSKRFEDQPEGYRVLGVSIGVEKDKEGSNVVEYLTEYDAAKRVHAKLKDGSSVFVRGELEFSSFTNEKGEKTRNKKFNVRNLYLTKEDIDFEAEGFEELAKFKQKIIYMGIEKADDKEDPRFLVEAKIVTYNSIEDTEFIIRDPALANQFRKSLKPYTAIDVWGVINNKVETEDVEETPVWGTEDTFKNVNKSYIRELVITGADPSTIDKDTYSEDKVEDALKALKEFGDTNDDSEGDSWGDSSESSKVIDDEDLPW